MSNTPNDAEIDEVTLDVLGYAALDKETNETARMIARAVLAKWGSPQPVAREQQWIDPNDKTQRQYLPHIGEPVLFCHMGKTYYGKHNGGSFVSGVGFAQKQFNTWGCHWMYPPAAHGITQKEDSNAE